MADETNSPAEEPSEKSWPDRPALQVLDSEKPGPRRVPLWTFVLTLICFTVVSLLLGLGLGLGLPRYRTVYAAAPFNYSSFYGIPDKLDVVSIDQLIKPSELNLETGFVVSNNATVREYVFNVTQALAAPDGFQKPMILVNGQSPGPLIEANTGDIVRVQVNNLMSNWSTTIHWHGINQHLSTWMDGVAGVSQCGIPPGQNFTYEFKIDQQRGTFWWHAHLSVQYSDGLYGPLIIHDPTEMIPETNGEKILFVGDVYHTYGAELLPSYLNTTSKWVPFESGVEPLPDNILMNGQNIYNCSVTSSTYTPSKDSPFSPNCTGGRRYSTKIKTGQSIRLRLINSSSFLSYWFSIDNHDISIVELDGVEVAPISARGVYLNIGQRVSVIVTANQTAGNYFMRATLGQTCFLPYAPYTSTALASGGYAVQGILSYDDIDLSAEPIGVAGNVSNPYGVENNGVRGDVWEGCDDMPFDMPQPMRTMPAVNASAANSQYIEYVFRQAQDVNRIFINKTAYAPLPSNCTLWKAVEQQFTVSEANSYNSWDFGLNQQVLLLPDADQGAQIVINSRDAMEHPWHLHGTSALQRGHTFQVVGWGNGYYGVGNTTWNLANPMRRDTLTVPAMTHVVLRFVADNPGIWSLHCHVAWHMEGGMFLSLAETPDKLVTLVQGMNQETKALSLSFCGVNDDQDFTGNER